MTPNKAVLKQFNGRTVVSLELAQNLETLIELSDYEKIKDFHWIPTYSKKSKTWYVYSQTQRNLVRTSTYLHRTLLNAQKGVVVDHKNHDGLNNLRDNIRIATYQENNWNSRPRKRTQCLPQGVCRIKNGKYQAHIKINHERINLGLYETIEEAQKAYLAKKIAVSGDFCYNK